VDKNSYQIENYIPKCVSINSFETTWDVYNDDKYANKFTYIHKSKIKPLAQILYKILSIRPKKGDKYSEKVANEIGMIIANYEEKYLKQDISSLVDLGQDAWTAEHISSIIKFTDEFRKTMIVRFKTFSLISDRNFNLYEYINKNHFSQDYISSYKTLICYEINSEIRQIKKNYCAIEGARKLDFQIEYTGIADQNIKLPQIHDEYKIKDPIGVLFKGYCYGYLEGLLINLDQLVEENDIANNIIDTRLINEHYEPFRWSTFLGGMVGQETSGYYRNIDEIYKDLICEYKNCKLKKNEEYKNCIDTCLKLICELLYNYSLYNNEKLENKIRKIIEKIKYELDIEYNIKTIKAIFGNKTNYMLYFYGILSYLTSFYDIQKNKTCDASINDKYLKLYDSIINRFLLNYIKNKYSIPSFCLYIFNIFKELKNDKLIEIIGNRAIILSKTHRLIDEIIYSKLNGL